MVTPADALDLVRRRADEHRVGLLQRREERVGRGVVGAGRGAGHAAAAVLGRRVDAEAVEVVRFRQPILPQSPCTLTIQMPDEARRVRFALRNEKGVVTDGRLVLTEECAHG